MADETVHDIIRKMRCLAEAMHDAWINDPNQVPHVDCINGNDLIDFANRIEMAYHNNAICRNCKSVDLWERNELKKERLSLLDKAKELSAENARLRNKIRLSGIEVK